MLKKIIITALIIIIVVCVVAVTFGYWILSDPVKLASSYYSIDVGTEDIVDYQMFLNPTGKFEILRSIDEPIRKQIADYMKKNSLVLQPGLQEFNRVDGTFNTLIREDFKFMRTQ